MQRARASDRDQFAAALAADARAFSGAREGRVSVPDRTPGTPAHVVIEREGPGGAAVALVVRVCEDPPGLLALSVEETRRDTRGPREAAPRVLPVLKDAGGAFYAQTHVGRLVAVGEIAEYFWTFAGACLEDEGD